MIPHIDKAPDAAVPLPRALRILATACTGPGPGDPMPALGNVLNETANLLDRAAELLDAVPAYLLSADWQQRRAAWQKQLEEGSDAAA